MLTSLYTWALVHCIVMAIAATICVVNGRAVREVVKAFDELMPTSVLKDRALAIAIELRHPAYDCFYLAVAERNTSPLVTADDRLIRRCADTPFEKLVQSL